MKEDGFESQRGATTYHSSTARPLCSWQLSLPPFPSLLPTDSSLTWQQALLSSNKPRSTTGLAYDTFADARDAATFGASNSNANFQGRTRSGSLGNRNSHPDSSNSSIYIDDVFNQSSPISSVHHPSTPIKGRGKGNNKPTPNKANNQHPNVNAYAGPNFHNSPSPASLPAPQFKARNSRNFGNGLNGHHPLGESTSSSNNSYGSGSGSGSGSDSGSESGKEEMNRSTRSVTAPVDNRNSFNQDNRQTTIENLLARMMRTPIWGGLIFNIMTKRASAMLWILPFSSTPSLFVSSLWFSPQRLVINFQITVAF